MDKANWRDLETLFEAKGGPSYCWCMAWRRPLSGALPKSGKAYVDDGSPIGILGYEAGEPIAWCSVAPRPTFRGIGGHDEAGEDPARVWSIACFYVKRERRREGLMRRLIEAAAAEAKAAGAAVVEAYPVDPDSPSYRFMGFVDPFHAAGFHEVKRAGTRRHVMRLDL